MKLQGAVKSASVKRLGRNGLYSLRNRQRPRESFTNAKGAIAKPSQLVGKSQLAGEAITAAEAISSDKFKVVGENQLADKSTTILEYSSVIIITFVCGLLVCAVSISAQIF